MQLNSIEASTRNLFKNFWRMMTNKIIRIMFGVLDVASMDIIGEISFMIL
mgnify:CR=1 FL=1